MDMMTAFQSLKNLISRNVWTGLQPYGIYVVSRAWKAVHTHVSQTKDSNKSQMRRLVRRMWTKLPQLMLTLLLLSLGLSSYIR